MAVVTDPIKAATLLVTGGPDELDVRKDGQPLSFVTISADTNPGAGSHLIRINSSTADAIELNGLESKTINLVHLFAKNPSDARLIKSLWFTAAVAATTFTVEGHV